MAIGMWRMTLLKRNVELLVVSELANIVVQWIYLNFEFWYFRNVVRPKRHEETKPLSTSQSFFVMTWNLVGQRNIMTSCHPLPLKTSIFGFLPLRNQDDPLHSRVASCEDDKDEFPEDFLLACLKIKDPSKSAFLLIHFNRKRQILGLKQFWEHKVSNAKKVLFFWKI